MVDQVVINITMFLYLQAYYLTAPVTAIYFIRASCSRFWQEYFNYYATITFMIETLSLSNSSIETLPLSTSSINCNEQKKQQISRHHQPTGSESTMLWLSISCADDAFFRHEPRPIPSMDWKAHAQCKRSLQRQGGGLTLVIGNSLGCWHNNIWMDH